MRRANRMMYLYTLPVLLGSVLATAQEKRSLPNVIYIMADDLGIGDLGCYGQKRIKTPTIDKLAEDGMIFAQHYAGCTVSAPSRCVLMTGKHTGHSFIRGNKDVSTKDGYRFDYPLADDEITVAEIMHQRDYITACIGKWGLGGPGTEGHPNNQGFDYFYGYLGQANAHRYYPDFLFENQEMVKLDKKVYSHDLIMDKALDFVKRNADRPFFLYLVPTIPHADIIFPLGELGDYDGQFEETPYPGGGYTAQKQPNATYAAMISRLDRDIQRMMDLLEKEGIANNTLVIFTSDNGNHQEGGHKSEYFDSNGGFRGTKRDLYDGGIRTPFIAHWPALIQPGSVTYNVSAFWDFLPTLCDIVGVPVPKGTDGISYLPTLIGKKQRKHDHLYWEFHEQGGKQAVLKDNWKLIRLNADTPDRQHMELYNLSGDPMEVLDVSRQYPGRVKELIRLMDAAHTPSALYPFKYEQ